jgi:hypothetical protein
MVQVDGAGEHADPARPGSIRAYGVGRSRVNPRIADEPEIVVRGKHEQIAPLGPDPGTRAGLQRQLKRVDARFACPAHEIENPPATAIDQLVFAKGVRTLAGKEAIEKTASSGRMKTFNVKRSF